MQPADPRARRNAATLVLVFTFLGTVAYFATDRFVTDLKDLAWADPGLAVEQAGMAIKLLALTLGVFLAGFSAWLFHFSLRSARAECFPPPGTRLIRERTTLTGEPARARARLGYVLAAVIAAAAVVLPAYVWHTTTLLTRP